LITTRVSSVPWLQPQALFPKGRITTSLSPFDLFPIVFDELAVKRLQDGAPIEEWFSFFDIAHRVVVYLPDKHDAGFKKFLGSIIEFAQRTSEPELQTLSFKTGIDSDAPSPMPAYAVCSGGSSPLG
jgi:hypothetical protein